MELHLPCLVKLGQGNNGYKIIEEFLPEAAARSAAVPTCSESERHQLSDSDFPHVLVWFRLAAHNALFNAMKLTILNQTVYFGIQVPLSSFPKLLQDHLTKYPTTPDIEKCGMDLAAKNFPENDTKEFLEKVCYWGGYSGVGGRVLKQNSIKDICTGLREATSILAAGQSVADALTRVNKLRGLGTPSFASKHLRFLRPDLCGVFDSILDEVLPYSFDATGYSDFCADCAVVAKQLAASGIANPATRAGGAWFVADVEGALYMAALQ